MMGKSKRKETCTPGFCKYHGFKLTPIRKSGYFTKIQKIKFCPLYNNKTKQYDKSTPKFNRDKKSYNPAFIYQPEQVEFGNNDSFNKQAFDTRLKKMLEQDVKRPILIPRPCRPVLFCHVCKEEYSDYLDHIGTESHRYCLKESSSTAPMNKLIEKYRKIRANQIKAKLRQVNEEVYDTSTKQTSGIKAYRQNISLEELRKENAINKDFSLNSLEHLEIQLMIKEEDSHSSSDISDISENEAKLYAFI